MSRILCFLAAATLLLPSLATGADAAELRVFSTIGVQAALEELTPKFQTESGDKLNITWATAAILVKRVQAGERADIYVLTKQSLDALDKHKRIVTGSSTVKRAQTPRMAAPLSLRKSAIVL